MPVVGPQELRRLTGSAHIVAAFHQGLKEVGFIEGQNVAIEYRYADNQTDRLPEADLIRRPVAVIVGEARRFGTGGQGGNCDGADRLRERRATLSGMASWLATTGRVATSRA